VFETGGDPIRLGLVASLNRPAGNITGVTQLNEEVAPKRLELLHELVPTVSVITLLVNPTDPALSETPGLTRIPRIRAEFRPGRPLAFELQRDTQLGAGSAGIFSKRSARTLAIMREVFGLPEGEFANFGRTDPEN